MLLILNNLLLPLSYNYQHFLLFFGESFLLFFLLCFLLDIANPKFEIIPSRKLTKFCLKLNTRICNVILITLLIILLNIVPYKNLIFKNTINVHKTTN